MISKYLRLIRPVAWITFLFPFSVGLGLGITQKSDPVNIVLAFFVFIFWMSFSFILNAISDKNVDKYHNGRSKDMNLARQPIVTGEITLKTAFFLSVIFFILSLLFAWLISTFFFILTLLIDLIGYIYSMPPLRLKTKPVGDILCNALAAVGIFTAGLSFNEQNIDYLIILGTLLLAAIFYIPTVLTDYDFDKKAGLTTSAVYFGAKKILQIMIILTIINITIWLIICITANIEFKILGIISIFYSIIFTFASNLKLRQQRLYLHENWILIPFPIISLAFILYGILKLIGWITLGFFIKFI